MTRARRLLVAGLLAGAAIRAWALPRDGTGDMVVWKVWSFAGTYDLTGLYGVGGSPPTRRVLHWRDNALTVDYPPLSLDELAVAGHLYRLFSPTFEDGRGLNVAVKLPGLVAEVALLAGLFVWGRRRLPDAGLTWAMLALWLNPAVILDGPLLGYLDLQMAVPLVGAIVSAWNDWPALAGALAVIAALTKAHAVFAWPALAAILLWRTGPRLTRALRASLAGLGIGLAVLLPYVIRGAWDNLTQAVGRLAMHDMLSAQAPNVWWVFTWVLRVEDILPAVGWKAALTQETRILAISRATALGYPNARVVGLVIVAAALVWAAVRARRVRDLADAAALTSWCLFAYALFAAQVHENHEFAAIPPLMIAAALAREYRPVCWLVSAVVAVNLYLFYGLGADAPPLIARSITGIDLTVLLSVLNLAAFAWFTIALIRRTPRVQYTRPSSAASLRGTPNARPI